MDVKDYNQYFVWQRVAKLVRREVVCIGREVVTRLRWVIERKLEVEFSEPPPLIVLFVFWWILFSISLPQN